MTLTHEEIMKLHREVLENAAKAAAAAVSGELTPQRRLSDKRAELELLERRLDQTVAARQRAIEDWDDEIKTHEDHITSLKAAIVADEEALKAAEKPRRRRKPKPQRKRKTATGRTRGGKKKSAKKKTTKKKITKKKTTKKKAATKKTRKKSGR